MHFIFFFFCGSNISPSPLHCIPALLSLPFPVLVPSIHLHLRLSPSILPASLSLFIHPAGIDLAVQGWMFLLGLDQLNALLLFNLTLIYVRSRCPCSVVFKMNSLWNLGRAGTTEKPPQEARIKFHQWKTKTNKQSRMKPNRHMAMIFCSDWQLLIGLIQPLGPFSSLAALDTAVVLSNRWHRDPWESAGGSSEMRAICIREDKWICYKYNINQCSKTEMSYWKLNCSYFQFDMLVKALESVKMVVSPFLSDIIEKYNCF